MSISLRKLALHCGKSPRTIRRWCEKGLVPGAYRDRPSSHWKIDPDAYDFFQLQIRLRFQARTRRSRSKFLGGKSPKEFDALMRLRASDGPVELTIRTYAAAKGQWIGPFEEGTYGDEEIERMAEDLEIGQAYESVPDEWKALPNKELFLKALRLRQLGKRITALSLARELGFSRATLYRRYPSEAIRRMTTLLPCF